MRIILITKDFSKVACHVGLNVASLNTSKVLNRAGIPCETWTVEDSNKIRQKIREDISSKKNPKISICVISAPWILPCHMEHLLELFPHIRFVVNIHSNVGFLQADPRGIDILRSYFELTDYYPNFHVSANSEKMQKWLHAAYHVDALFLPNLYFLEGKAPEKHTWRKAHKLRIGIFGASRPLKNHVSAAGAAIVIGRREHANVEIFLSSGRLEYGSNTILNAIRSLTKDLKHVHLHEVGWPTWKEFRKIVGKMHLLLQPSYSESFNMISADGVAEGIPTVTSEAITWTPKSWQAPVDNVLEIADKGVELLKDKHTNEDGFVALSNYVAQGLKSWKKFLKH